jgi:hypothetical protein
MGVSQLYRTPMSFEGARASFLLHLMLLRALANS